MYFLFYSWICTGFWNTRNWGKYWSQWR